MGEAFSSPTLKRKVSEKAIQTKLQYGEPETQPQLKAYEALSKKQGYYRKVSWHGIRIWRYQDSAWMSEEAAYAHLLRKEEQSHRKQTTTETQSLQPRIL